MKIDGGEKKESNYGTRKGASSQETKRSWMGKSVGSKKINKESVFNHTNLVNIMISKRTK